VDKDGRAFGAAAISADVKQVAAGCLCKQWRHVTGRTKIQRTRTKRFEKRRPGCEFRPADLDAAVGKALFERALAFGERKHAVLLPADAKLAGGRPCPAEARQECRGSCRTDQSQSLSACCHRPCPLLEAASAACPAYHRMQETLPYSSDESTFRTPGEWRDPSNSFPEIGSSGTKFSSESKTACHERHFRGSPAFAMARFVLGLSHTKSGDRHGESGIHRFGGNGFPNGGASQAEGRP
jgi:hypothetical protein